MPFAKNFNLDKSDLNLRGKAVLRAALSEEIREFGKCVFADGTVESFEKTFAIETRKTHTRDDCGYEIDHLLDDQRVLVEFPHAIIEGDNYNHFNALKDASGKIIDFTLWTIEELAAEFYRLGGEWGCIKLFVASESGKYELCDVSHLLPQIGTEKQINPT
jgi:hypothetical protein